LKQARVGNARTTDDGGVLRLKTLLLAEVFQSEFSHRPLNPSKFSISDFRSADTFRFLNLSSRFSTRPIYLIFGKACLIRLNQKLQLE
jgi:hypothetical protein